MLVCLSLGFRESRISLEVDRYITISVPRNKLEKTRFWYNKPVKGSQALKFRTIKIDTKHYRKFVLQTTDRSTGRVLYDADPVVDYLSTARKG